MVIVDTSAWIAFFRRDGDLLVKLSVKNLLDEYEAALCGPVDMEFLGGARPHERDRIRVFFDVLPYLPNDQKIWRKAADTYSLLRSNGVIAPWNDVIVATLSMERGCRVYAVDRHFEAMAEHFPSLRLYEPGYNGRFSRED